MLGIPAQPTNITKFRLNLFSASDLLQMTIDFLNQNLNQLSTFTFLKTIDLFKTNFEIIYKEKQMTKNK